MREYDLTIIGAGPGGYEAALDAAGIYGMKTALIEKEALGGTCLNHGCIPTKSLLHSADLYRQMKGCDLFGLHAEAVTFDMEKIQERKDEVVSTLRSGIAQLMKQKKVEVIAGTGKILDPHTVEVISSDGGTLRLDTERILIATGSGASVPPIPGADLPGVMTSDELLEKRELPGHLLIIGGGVIGMEFASVCSAFGTRVTVLEALPRIIANLDKELSQSLKMLMKKRGVTIFTGALVKEIRRSAGGGLECVYEEKEKEQTVSCDEILICTGRRPSTEGLFGENFALDTEKGRILINENCETSMPGVYAIGDVTGGTMLAHTATAMGRNAVAHMNSSKASAAMEQGAAARMSSEASAAMEQNAASRIHAPICMDVIPSCIYTDPEIASVGLTIEQAKAAGIDADSKKIVMSSNGKTVLSAQERGFIKVVFRKEDRRILGAQMMCARASDMISEFAEAIVHGLTMEQMAGVIRPHPTFSEAITDACR